MDEILSPGNVFYIHCNFINPPKKKYLILCTTVPKALSVFINSEIPEFIASSDELRDTQVSIDAASHDFLKYDSVVDCHELCSFPLDELTQEGADIVMGRLSDDVLNSVRNAIENSPTIPQRQIEWVLNGLKVK